MSYYRLEHTPDNDPELPYTVTHEGDEEIEEIGYLTRLQATRIALGVNLLMKLVEIGPQIAPTHPDNLQKAAEQQLACEDAIARYADILNRTEDTNADPS